MRVKSIGVIIVLFLFTACASIPKETVLLSQTLGNDLQALHKSHCDITDLYFKKIENDINSFVDDVYVPFVIHYALKSQLQDYKNGKACLYSTIELAGKQEGKEESKAAINDMQEFLEAAQNQIYSKRNELLSPIKQQHSKITQSINQSYENAINGNLTITAYLQSLRKLKGTQQEALSIIGFQGADSLLTNSLLNVSERVEKALEIGNKIDIKSKDAYKQLEEISNKIKDITNKK